MRMLAGGLFALVLALPAMQAPAVAAAGSCSDLAKMALPRATITLAASVQAGAFTPDAPGRRRRLRRATRVLPRRCNAEADERL